MFMTMLSEPKIRRGESSHFLRVEEVLRTQAAKFPASHGGVVQRDVHLMLFDPTDGCYHAFLAGAAERVSDASWSVIQRGLKEYVTQYGTKWVTRWIKVNVAQDEDRVQALRFVLRTAAGRAIGIEDPRQRARLCRILLSALPSHRHWDICGFYDAVLTSSHAWAPARLKRAAREVSEEQGRALEYGSWSVWHYEQHALHAHLLAGLRAGRGEICLDALNEGEFPILYRGQPELGGGNDQQHYALYTGLYEPLYQALFPERNRLNPEGSTTSVQHSEWHTLLIAPLYLWGSFVGIVFIGVGGLGAIDCQDLSEWLAMFDAQQRSTISSTLQSLALVAFDRRFFERLREGVSREVMWDALCECLPSLVRCEYCVRSEQQADDRDPASGAVKVRKWEWSERGYLVRFTNISQQAERPAAPGIAPILTLSFEQPSSTSPHVFSGVTLEIGLARQSECSDSERESVRSVVELKVETFNHTLRRALAAEFLRRERGELLNFIEAFGHELKNLSEEIGWEHLLEWLDESDERTPDREQVIACLSRMSLIHGFGAGIRRAGRLFAHPETGEDLRREWLDATDSFRYDDASVSSFHRSVAYLFTILRKSYSVRPVSVVEGRPGTAVSHERDWTPEPFVPTQLDFPPLQKPLRRLSHQSVIIMASILAEPLRNAIKAASCLDPSRRVVYWTLEVPDDRTALQITIWNETLAVREDYSSGVAIVDSFARRLGIAAIRQTKPSEWARVGEEPRTFRSVVITIHPHNLGRTSMLWRLQ